MSTGNVPDPEERSARVAALPVWVHSIDLGDGLSTPGLWSPETQAPIKEALNDVDFQGKKVLDLGCLDGLWSFEAERRGASEVYSTDALRLTTPGREPYFELARDLLGSRARYFPDVPVHDVAKLGVSDFDIVLFLGVWYHLKDPLLAFARLRQVMKEGAVIVAEGQVIDSTDVSARFFYRDHFGGDRTNWWVPTIPCVHEWMECNFFEVLQGYRQTYGSHSGVDPTGRYIVRARAVRRQDPNLGVPDDELRAFDLNRYFGSE